LGENGTPRLRGPATKAGSGTSIAILTLAAGLAACGSGERQDANEPSGKFPVTVTQASFPNRQRISERTDLVLAIKNAGKKPLPDLAVTIYTGEIKAQSTGSGPAQGSFSIRLDQPNLANPSRPVWILENNYPKLLGAGVTLANVDAAPTAGAEAAQTDTFQFGRVKPGESKEIDWRVTPTMGGSYTVHYQVAAGLQGKAKAVTPDGGPVRGEFLVTIATKPPQTCVSPSGKIVQGKCQLSGG
jgi:hypothetical protein